MSTFLIYSQNPDLFDLLRETVQKEHKLFYALNQSRLEDIFRSEKIDAILYDKVQLNRHDIDEIKRIRQISPNIKIVVMYLYFQGNSEFEKRLDSLAHVILSKPCDLTEIPKILQEPLSISK